MMASYTRKRFVNPLNKNVGRRTGKDFRAGKNIRIGEDGFENFDDYFSESDAEVTREYSRRHASTIREESESAGTQELLSDEEYKENQPSNGHGVSQSVPNGTFSNNTYNNITSSQSLSQGGQNRSKFGWLRNRDIGRRTGKNITASKIIRVDEQGFENFDDYFSESDVSSLSSRLSVSVVKPVPRRSAVSNLVVGDATPSVSSQDSQRNSTADEGGSEGEDSASQTDLSEEKRARTSSPASDTHHESVYTENETFTMENSSKHKHSDVSEIEQVDKTGQSELVDEDSVESDENEELTGKQENTTHVMSRSNSVKPQYVNTPLSSRRSRSHISVIGDKYSDSKTIGHNTETNVDISSASTQNESRSVEQNNSGKHKLSTGVDASRNRSKTVDTSKASESNLEHIDTESDSEVEDEIETEHTSVDNTGADQSVNNDRDDQDIYEEQDTGNDEDENEDEHKDTDRNEDFETDDESETEVKNNTNNRKSKSTAKDSVNSSHREVSVTDHSAEKEVALTNKSVSSNVTEVQETEEDDQSMSDNDSNEEDDDLRPSQAHTNIDVAGNRSGSITKLDIPVSVVSFNRTRKRLSYSAGEASEESLQRNKTRIEKANEELFKKEDSSKSKEVKGHFHAIPSKDSTRSTDSVCSKKIKDNETVAEENSDFVCLVSRSTLQQTQTVHNNADEDEDDIEVLDYIRPSVTADNGKKKVSNNKAKKAKTLDTDSHSDSETQIKHKNVKQGSKSEVKGKKTKDNTKHRRKTTNGSKVNGLTVSLNFKKQKNDEVVIDSENSGFRKKEIAENLNENLNADVSTRSNVNRDDNKNDDGTNITASNESNKTANTGQKKKGKKKTDKSGKKRENADNENNKTESTMDVAHEIETSGTDLNHFDEAHISSFVNENERNTDEHEEIDSPIRKGKTKTSSKKTNKTQNSSKTDVDSLHSVKEGNRSRKRKLPSKVKETSNGNSFSGDNIESHDTDSEGIKSPNGDNQVKKKLEKKQKGKPLVSKRQSKVKTDSEPVDTNVDETISNKSLKRKSSSDDCLEDNSEKKLQTKKARKSRGSRKLKGRTRNSKQKNSSSSFSDNVEEFQAEDVESKTDLNELGKRTPIIDSRLSVPTHFGSGVSFRVSRRSELLEDVGSGYIGETSVHMEPTGGLTPCISRPGVARKSKGRRVTICPEENIEHNISGDKSDENNRNSPHFRRSSETSGNATSLLDPDSTPVHYFETTHKSTPGKSGDSVIEDRLIKPSPPEEGLRRSQRTRLKPIAWYKNEQVVFDYRRRSGPAIIGVKPSLEVKWNKLEEERRKKRVLRNQIRKASQIEKEDKPYRKLSIHNPLPSDIWIEENQDPEVTVFNQNLQEEDGIDCIGKRDAKPVGPTYETPKKEDPFVITKLLDHPCISAGKLHIKPNAEKPEQLATGDYTLFFIEYGKVLVKLHKTSFLVESGETFMVPIGNTYSISNLRSDTAKLFYTVHKQVDTSDTSATELR